MNNTKRKADAIVAECNGNPICLKEWMEDHWEQIDSDMKKELYIRLCTLSGQFI